MSCLTCDVRSCQEFRKCMLDHDKHTHTHMHTHTHTHTHAHTHTQVCPFRSDTNCLPVVLLSHTIGHKKRPSEPDNM